MASLPPIDLRTERQKRLEKSFYKKLDKRDKFLQDDVDDWFDTSMQEGDDGIQSFINGTVTFLQRFPDLTNLIGMNIGGMTDEKLIEWLESLTKSQRRKVIEELTALRQKRDIIKTQLELGIPFKYERKEQKGSGLEDPYFGRMTLV